jgi:hypothetical protein
MVVVLPAPLRPSRAWISPGATCKVSRSTARTSRYSLVRSTASIATGKPRFARSNTTPTRLPGTPLVSLLRRLPAPEGKSFCRVRPAAGANSRSSRVHGLDRELVAGKVGVRAGGSRHRHEFESVSAAGRCAVRARVSPDPCENPAERACPLRRPGMRSVCRGRFFAASLRLECLECLEVWSALVGSRAREIFMS